MYSFPGDNYLALFGTFLIATLPLVGVFSRQSDPNGLYQRDDDTPTRPRGVAGRMRGQLIQVLTWFVWFVVW